MIDNSLVIPIETLVLFDAFAIGLAFWSGRESGQAKEQRLRRVAVDDAFRRGKQAGFGFLDAISEARTDAMSGVAVVNARPFDYEKEMAVYDYEKEMEA